MPERFRTQPLYMQLRDVLAQRIASGEWKSGNTVPNEIDLARELGVSQGTVRRSLDLLESEHVVTRRQGRGTSYWIQLPRSAGTVHQHLLGQG